MGQARNQATGWTREGVKRRIVERLWVRFHMSLILMACGLSAMLTSWALLKIGVGAMLVRFPLAIVVAYAMFLLGVWLWVRYAEPVVEGEGEQEAPGRPLRGKKKGNSLVDGGDLLDIRTGGSSGGSGGSGGGFSGKGGGFDGGGASGAWAEGGTRGALSSSSSQLNAQALAASSMQESSSADTTSSLASRSGGGGSKSGSGSSFSLDIDGEGLVLVVLAIALVAALVVASGYLVWAAPDILSEAAFGAVLAGGLARRAKNEDALGWVAGVVKRTWWPFTIVLVLAIAFAGYSASHYPQAKTFKQALEAATSPDAPK
jgi:hypothetical protein